jgi:hypothetical protein
MDGFAQGSEVAAGFRGEKEQRLLSFVGNDDEDALFADGAVPGFDALVPVGRRRIGGSAKKGDDEDVAG